VFLHMATEAAVVGEIAERESFRAFGIPVRVS
jgi:hypothetical protein